MKNYTIYALKDPRDNKVFYVGCSSNVESRFKSHYSGRRDNDLKTKKVEEIRSAGMKPMLSEICFFSSKKDAVNFEKEFTQDLMSNGFELTNIKIGMNHSARTIEGISKANKGRASKLKGLKRDPAIYEKVKRTNEKTGYSERFKEISRMARESRMIKIKDDQGNYYNSLSDAVKETGCHMSNIIAVLRGKQKQSKGRKFFYA